MAGNENSGGYQPNAPQNNPMNIGANGGNTQGGNTQAAMRFPDMRSLGSTGVETEAIAGAAPLYAAPTGDNSIRATTLTAPTEDNLPVTDGARTGDGANSIPGLPTGEDTPADIKRLASYLPALEAAAMLPNSSEAFNNYVRIVRATVMGAQYQ